MSRTPERKERSWAMSKKWIPCLLVFVLSGPLRADVVFVGDPTSALTLTGAFKFGDPNYETSLVQGDDKADITWGAEGEVLLSIDDRSTVDAKKTGTLKFTVDRAFKITGKQTDVDHYLKARGNLFMETSKTFEDAMFSVHVKYTDQILDGTTIRSSLEDSGNWSRDGKNKKIETFLLAFDKSSLDIPLPVKDTYILHSEFYVSYEFRSAWIGLDLWEHIYDPRGVGYGTDKQGFNSTVVPAPGAVLLGAVGLGMSGAYFRKRRETPAGLSS
jgi:hypothetical protein